MTKPKTKMPGQTSVIAWQPISTVDKTTVVDLWVPVEAGPPFGRIPECRWCDRSNAWVSPFFPRFRFVASEPTHWFLSPLPPA